MIPQMREQKGVRGRVGGLTSEDGDKGMSRRPIDSTQEQSEWGGKAFNGFASMGVYKPLPIFTKCQPSSTQTVKYYHKGMGEGAQIKD